jgi:DNA-binding NtrC family response regulator
MDQPQMWDQDAFPEGRTLSLLGESPRMQALRAAIGKVAHADSPVLITGEIGSGKELAARLVHQQSGRASGPFLAVSGAAISSDFFRSSAPAGTEPARGVQAARGGTLYIDGVGDLSVDAQTALLRYLQEHDSAEGDPPRLITASHQDLGLRSQAGEFREDLYYRLNTLKMDVPPLRDRDADIGMLADHFLGELSGSRELQFSEATRQRLASYPWPGNVRELRNRVMQAAVMCEDKVLSPDLLGFNEAASNGNGMCSISLREKRQVAEREAITEALRQSHGQVPAAAASLGISRAQLYRLIGRLRVDHHHPYASEAGKVAQGSP